MSANARCVDRGLELRSLRQLGVYLTEGGDLVEMATHRHHAEMLGGKLHLSMKRVELPGSHTNCSFP